MHLLLAIQTAKTQSEDTQQTVSGHPQGSSLPSLPVVAGLGSVQLHAAPPIHTDSVGLPRTQAAAPPRAIIPVF